MTAERTDHHDHTETVPLPASGITGLAGHVDDHAPAAPPRPAEPAGATGVTGRAGAAGWFPGGTAVSRVRVYDWPTPDGRCGGSPHLHTASTEGYVVIGGSGRLETLSGSGYAEYTLEPGVVLWFTPGTVHRLVNSSLDLDILVVMQNAGLPEAGDAVFTFPAPILADPGAYAAAATLAEPDPAAARARRDLAIEGYGELRARVDAEGPAALSGLYRAAVELVGHRATEWRALWEDRVVTSVQRTEKILDGLAAGRPDHLAESAVVATTPTADDRLGMCGRLQVWDFTATPLDPR